VTIILIKHFIKGTAAKAVHKVGGSSGYVNAVRAAYVVVPSSEDETLKLLLPVKFNIGPRPKGLAFHTEALPEDKQLEILQGHGGHLEEADRAELAGQLFRIAWRGETDEDADEVLAEQARRDRGGSNKVEKAAEWVEHFLSESAYPSDEIVEAGKQAGYTFDNIKEAKALLKTKGLRSSNRGRFQGQWWSGFGEPEMWILRIPRTASTQTSLSTPHTPHSPHYGTNTGKNAKWGGKDTTLPTMEETPHYGGDEQPIVGRVGSVGSEGSEGGQTPQTGWIAPDAGPDVHNIPFE
jgi:hypothetical protein